MSVHTFDLTSYVTTALEPLSLSSLPRVMTVAGSDSSGGAGIEADLKTISAHQCYGLTCINSLTAQNTTGVTDAFELPYEFVMKILKANFEDISIDAIKTGMLSASGIKALSQAVEIFNYKGDLVVDPVLVSTSGFKLSRESNLKLIIDQLFEKATLITPNFMEAMSILAVIDNSFASQDKLFEYYNNLKIENNEQVVNLCKKITQNSTVKNVLIKGGHLKYDATSIFDILYQSETDVATIFKSNFVDSTSTHGTGCTLASAIASNLAKKMGLVDAVGNGIIYVQNGILTADRTIGSGHGPLRHFEIHKPISFQKIDYDGQNLMEYLISHPFVKKDWDHYIHHPFIEKLAKLELPTGSFLGYLKQDHAYLLNYAKTHCLAAAIAPNTSEFVKEIEILNNIISEMDKHKDKLLKLGIPEEDIDKEKLNSLCQAYSDYLLKVARTGSWLEINVAMSACLFGYREACQYGSTIYEKKESSLKDTLYKEWLDDYCSEWYNQLCNDGEEVLQNCKFESSQLSTLLEILSNTVKLEIKFWNAFI